MASIDILTGQHVTIKYEPAGVAKRMLAFFLDYLFMVAYLVALAYIIFELLGKYGDTANITFAVSCLPIMCYHLLFESLMNGQTPGKLIAKIRVTHIDGSAPNFVSYFLRWILLPIDFWITYGGVGLLFILFTKNHQRLGDLAAGTTVVKLVPYSAKYDLDSVFNEFTSNYRPTFPQADTLTEGQIRLISELLESSSNKSAIDELALKIKQKFPIETKMDNRTFLETIVKDYNYYATLGI